MHRHRDNQLLMLIWKLNQISMHSHHWCLKKDEIEWKIFDRFFSHWRVASFEKSLISTEELELRHLEVIRLKHSGKTRPDPSTQGWRIEKRTEILTEKVTQKSDDMKMNRNENLLYYFLVCLWYSFKFCFIVKWWMNQHFHKYTNQPLIWTHIFCATFSNLKGSVFF